ncbi:MAG: phospho-sugar mutase [Bacteroidales bacterium]|nr:phospho-sugar mutase [Bacteroidales bacterium]
MTTQDILQKAKTWLTEPIDSDTQNQIKHLIENNIEELTESFYRDLEFGTGGLRGIMGVGSNRMNKYTVGMATQGLANYIKKTYPHESELKAAIAFDTRNNSRFFAGIAAEVLSANNIKVFLFDEIHPTPLLSFAVRHLNCHTGIVITASHNPKEYNGYKVYWNDGGQLIAPHDKNVIEEVNKIGHFSNVNFDKKPELIVSIGKEIDRNYLEKVRALALSPEIVEKHKDLKIVFTPIHGTAVNLVPEAMKMLGFSNIIFVPEQMIPDGNFPTVEYPNPEEAKALQMAIDKARAVDADLVLGTDPDADRVGVATKNKKGEFVLLNGNQTASILYYYILSKWQEKGKLTGKEFTVKTIVTTELLTAIAKSFNIEQFDVLTGFKFIANIILKNESAKQFICGGEESYGYLVGDFVRDKDAVISCCMIAEATAWAANQGKTLYDLLIDIYTKYGLYKEHLVSVTKKGKSGAEEIVQMMVDYRNNPPLHINNSKVVFIKDYQKSIITNLTDGTEKKIDLPKSNVLQFVLEDETVITIRPSGTEPKIKFYFGVKGNLCCSDAFENVNKHLDTKIKNIITDLKL